ncbi:hypothetical protein QBC34DRAFT_433414 [Podospora aff. communis PSN243]|uniref:F-box domain-containing protein n=1 Tax=Podospora aff. communis PSN243 TaxID=3040156 RepID=A0AAV9H2Y7_9PEZI|nr:hypothetical protein QBC34DRAFT_433414 [Podospora aff. communis PSN243]
MHMVMIGEVAETAAPHVMICLDDCELQCALRGDGPLNNTIRDNHPPIEMDLCSNMPQLLANSGSSTDMAKRASPIPSTTSYSVWSTEAEPKIGARLYVACDDGGPPRTATAGPVFSHGNKHYQTTVRHVFFRQEDATGLPSEPSFGPELDMDDPKPEDGDNGDRGTGGPVTSSSAHSTTKAFSPQRYASAPPSPGEQYQKYGPGKGKDPEIPRGAFYIGKAVPETVQGPQRAIDYALIEVQASDDVDPNLISYDPSDSSKKLRVTRPANMTRLRPQTPVIVATPSGPVSGTLLATKAYIKPRFQRQSTALYPLVLDDQMELGSGDCGSPVVLVRGDEVHMLGHILFGHPGTAVAYLLPMTAIIEDMAMILGPLTPDGSISLQPPPREKDTRAQNKRTEFASPKFYKDLEESVMPKTRRGRGLFGKFIEKLGNARSLIKAKEEKEEVVSQPGSLSFEDLFFQRLPPELRDQVIDCLTFREAMNLRHVSTRFRAAVSVNGHAISRRFLIKNPLPPLAQDLYPHPSPDLTHIDMVGHHHAVAWRLADHVVQWLRRDMFLYGSRFQKQQFQPKKVRMKQRLLPSLLLLGRFFEMCRLSLEEQGRKGETDRTDPITFEVSKDLMRLCGNELLFQTQDVALVLVTFLRRTMRAPSKYGTVEKTLRKSRVDPPPDSEIAAVLYHGGLEMMVNILDLEKLDKKVAAVREYCAPLSAPIPAKGSSSQEAVLDSVLTGYEKQGSLSDATPKSERFDIHPLLRRLPNMDDVWRPSAEAVLIERAAIRGERDLNSFSVALKELIRESETRADALYRNGHDLWHALSDSEQRHRSR